MAKSVSKDTATTWRICLIKKQLDWLISSYRYTIFRYLVRSTQDNRDISEASRYVSTSHKSCWIVSICVTLMHLDFTCMATRCLSSKYTRCTHKHTHRSDKTSALNVPKRRGFRTNEFIVIIINSENTTFFKKIFFPLEKMGE